MLTRRQVLAGTAAGSIAAIASARGVASAAPAADGFGVGFGNLQGGAAGVFQKADTGFSFFLKYRDSAAQIFYKEQIAGEIGVFFKFMKEDVAGAAFDKAWRLVDQFGGFLKDAVGAEAGFYKVTSSVAQIFIKYENVDQQLVEDVRTLADGMLLPSENACDVKIE